MTYLLDTNTCIHYLMGRPQILLDRFRSIPAKQVVVCSITRAELLLGALKSSNVTLIEQKRRTFLLPYSSFSFDDAAADQYAIIRATLEAKGTPIGPNDLLIAAIALANKLTLVTHNTREFGRIDGLQIEDWETA